jgi:hypothetical protein
MGALYTAHGPQRARQLSFPRGGPISNLYKTNKRENDIYIYMYIYIYMCRGASGLVGGDPTRNIWAQLGPMLGPFGFIRPMFLPMLGPLGPMLGQCGSILGPCCAYLGPFRRFGAHLGPCWAMLRPFGPMLGPFTQLLDAFGYILAFVGPIWYHFGCILGPFWAHVGSPLGPFSIQ